MGFWLMLFTISRFQKHFQELFLKGHLSFFFPIPEDEFIFAIFVVKLCTKKLLKSSAVGFYGFLEQLYFLCSVTNYIFLEASYVDFWHCDK